MIELIRENLATIIVSLILTAVIILVVRKMYRDKKAGKSACGCKCSGCPDSSVCHGGKKNDSHKS